MGTNIQQIQSVALNRTTLSCFETDQLLHIGLASRIMEECVIRAATPTSSHRLISEHGRHFDLRFNPKEKLSQSRSL